MRFTKEEIVDLVKNCGEAAKVSFTKNKHHQPTAFLFYGDKKTDIVPLGPIMEMAEKCLLRRSG